MHVIDAFGSAINRTTWLFTPFNAGTWARLGFIAFLAALASGSVGGGGGGGSYNVPTGGATGSGDDLSDLILQGREWLIEYLPFVIIGGLFVISIGIAFALLLGWLGSRGQFMLVRAVATGEPEIQPNWTVTSRLANSAWRFRIVMLALTALINIPLAIIAVFMVFGIASTGENGILPYILGLLPIILIGVAAGFTLFIVHVLFGVFVVPLMYLGDLLAMEGWSAFRVMARGNVLAIILLLLMRMGYFIAFGIASTIISIFTCCIGFLPVIHHILFAPFYVFDRAFSLYAIQSLGPDYTIFIQDQLLQEEEALEMID